MGVFSENAIIGASAAGGYDIDQSLRFNPADTPTMTYTPAGAGNRTTWTFSCWVKRCESTDSGSTGAHVLLSSAVASGVTAGNTDIRFTETNDLLFQNYYYHSPNEYNYLIRTNAKYRDPGAWYHVVAVWDTSNGTADDRMRLYVNGEQVTSMQLRTNPSSSFESHMNSGTAFQIADYSATANTELNGYLAEVHFIDGQALTPASFGETNSDTNQWQAIEYDGSYGTNGYYLKFQDSSALGDDSSGNTNDFTPTNLAATDQVLDSPTNNFATLNPLYNWSTSTDADRVYAEGNLKGSSSATGWKTVSSSQAIESGKWYWETTCFGSYNWQLGLARTDLSTTSNIGLELTGSYCVYCSGAGTGGTFVNSTNTGNNSYIWAANDVIMCAYDDATGKFWLGKNGTWFTSGNPATGANADFTVIAADLGDMVPAFSYYASTDGMRFNFGTDSSFQGTKTAQGNGGAGEDFYYTPPAGYKALNTSNLSDPAIALPTDYFNTILYTGNGGTQALTGVGFAPDLFWNKNRTGTYQHMLYNTISGATKYLSSGENDAEATDANSLTSFDSDGVTLGSAGSSNATGVTSVGWSWKGGGTASSNGDGTITSSVSANPTAGFSIVSYTSPGTNADGTVGHGLSQVPELVIVKNRDSAYNWDVWNTSLSSGYDLILNTTAAQTSGRWSTTIPTSSLVTLKNTYEVNGTDKYIAYCFHSVEGYSKVGGYTGNGGTDGPFVYTGFRPAWVMFKRTNSTSNWTMFDNKTDPQNSVGREIYADLSNAEGGHYNGLDFVSNGFKLRNTTAGFNASSGTFIYLAFAESPFKTANAR